MMWWLVVFASAGLIALGAGLLVRDLFPFRFDIKGRPARARRDARPSAGQSPERVAESAGIAARNSASTHAQDRLKRSVALEKKWSRLRKEIDAAVQSVNQSMQRISIAIGTPGQPTWSLENEGFGDYRRVRIDQESVAWLRLEITPDLRIRSRVRTHDAQFSDLNRDAEAAADRSGSALAQAVTDSLAGVFDFAVKRHSDLLRQEGPDSTATQPSVPQQSDNLLQQPSPAPRMHHHAPVPTAQMKPAYLPASTPSPSAALVDAAVTLVNRAFAEADAMLFPANDGRTTKAFSDRTLSIVGGNIAVGIMLIEPRADRIDISVGTLDLTQPQSTRKQSLPLSGLTVHSLAEAIATCAWSSIATASAKTAVA